MESMAYGLLACSPLLSAVRARSFFGSSRSLTRSTACRRLFGLGKDAVTVLVFSYSRATSAQPADAFYSMALISYLRASDVG